jgi:hypothetical protein
MQLTPSTKRLLNNTNDLPCPAESFYVETNVTAPEKGGEGICSWDAFCHTLSANTEQKSEVQGRS